MIVAKEILCYEESNHKLINQKKYIHEKIIDSIFKDQNKQE